MVAPKLRFKEFSGDWNSSTIGKICKIQTGNKDTQNKIENGLFPFFVRSQTIERINSFSMDCEAILTSGDGVGVGKNYHYINGKFDFHQRVYCLNKFTDNVIGKYVYIYFSQHFLKRVQRLSAKNSVDSVRMDMISQMKIELPSLEEQTKIANFLTQVDQKIEQLTQKHELLTQYKKGMMQKLFSQQIRFKADDGSEFGEWETKQLNEISSKNTTKNKKNIVTEVLTNSATKGIINQSEYFDREIVTESNLNSYFIIQLDDFVYNPRISVHAPVGPIKRNKKCIGIMSPLYTTFTFQYGHLGYLEHFFETHFWYDYIKSVSNSGARHDRMNITNKAFFEMPIPFPPLPEQTKIANFLSSIDQKIDLTHQQLQQAKQWKKGLLQHMFV